MASIAGKHLYGISSESDSTHTRSTVSALWHLTRPPHMLQSPSISTFVAVFHQSSQNDDVSYNGSIFHLVSYLQILYSVSMITTLLVVGLIGQSHLPE